MSGDQQTIINVPFTVEQVEELAEALHIISTESSLTDAERAAFDALNAALEAHEERVARQARIEASAQEYIAWCSEHEGDGSDRWPVDTLEGWR